MDQPVTLEPLLTCGEERAKLVLDLAKEYRQTDSRVMREALERVALDISHPIMVAKIHELKRA